MQRFTKPPRVKILRGFESLRFRLNMNKLATIVLNNDVIEILHNENLKHNPYLIRLTNYDNERYEVRASKEDLEELSVIIDDIIVEEPTK
jgi:hypothetical protein